MGSLCHLLVKLVAEYFIFPFCDFIEWSREGGLAGAVQAGYKTVSNDKERRQEGDNL